MKLDKQIYTLNLITEKFKKIYKNIIDYNIGKKMN